VSWNVDNITAHLGEKPSRGSLLEVVHALGSPDILCLQELRLREGDVVRLRLAEQALPDYALTHSLANDSKNASFRGGCTYGVGTYARRQLGTRPLPREDWEREGRLDIILLDAFRLAIANVYAVNGTSKPYWDHELGRIHGDRHAWKRRFHERVAAVGQALRERGYDLLLIGDWNVSQHEIDTTPRLRTEEPHATSRAHFAAAIVEGLDVVDVFRSLHPDARAYTWFNRRSRGKLDAARVDFALLSRSRLRDVVEASIDEQHVGRLGSDHAPIHLKLSPPG
jgi:exodeoxyribonuclease-3